VTGWPRWGGFSSTRRIAAAGHNIIYGGHLGIGGDRRPDDGVSIVDMANHAFRRHQPAFDLSASGLLTRSGIDIPLARINSVDFRTMCAYLTHVFCRYRLRFWITSRLHKIRWILHIPRLREFNLAAVSRSFRHPGLVGVHAKTETRLLPVSRQSAAGGRCPFPSRPRTRPSKTRLSRLA